MVYSKFLRGVVAVLLLGVMPAWGMLESAPAGLRQAAAGDLNVDAAGIFQGSSASERGFTVDGHYGVSRPDLDRYEKLKSPGGLKADFDRSICQLKASSDYHRSLEQIEQAVSELPLAENNNKKTAMVAALNKKIEQRARRMLSSYLSQVARYNAALALEKEFNERFIPHLSQESIHERNNGGGAAAESCGAGAGGIESESVLQQKEVSIDPSYDRRGRDSRFQWQQVGPVSAVYDTLAADWLRTVPQRYEKAAALQDLDLQATYLPSIGNVPLNFANKKIMRPIVDVMDRNAAVIASLAKAAFIAGIFLVAVRNLGGTKWLNRKIDEAFNKPSIYKVDTAKTLSEDKQRMSGELLVNGPEVQRQCNEVVELMRWHNALPKDKQREYKFKGVLFYGSPGTGKTSLARTIAYRSGWNLIELIADDFFKIKDMADRLAVLEEMFAKAEKLGKTVIFLDEFENMVKDRDLTGGASNPMLMKMLKLTEQGSSKFIIIAATNRKNDIDKAMLRRMRWQVEVPLPGLRQRYQILNNYFDTLLRNKGFTTKLDAMKLAQTLHSESGARLESFVERMRDRARLYGQTEIDEKIAREILIDMGILQAGPEEDDVVGKEAVHRDRGDGNGDSEEVAA